MLDAEQVRPGAIATQKPDYKVDTTPEVVSVRRPKGPVRAPFKVLWRELRFRYLPLAGFILAGLFAILLWRQWVLVETSSASDPAFAQKPVIRQTGAVLLDKSTALIPPLDTAATR